MIVYSFGFDARENKYFVNAYNRIVCENGQYLSLIRERTSFDDAASAMAYMDKQQRNKGINNSP